MKIETLCKPLEIHGPFETTEFRVDDSPFAFELLIKKLYKNPIQSIVRELSSNAWDSHQAAGTTDQLIEVDFPTNLDPYFTVKDFGTGLSPEQITDLYTVLFRSNRRDSNSFLGGYGLGSKSPLAYTDQFTVESRYQKVLYSYIVFTGPAGKPTISLATSHPTDEANGLTIKIPVLTQDHSNFRNAGRDTLIWFPSVKTNIDLTHPIPLIQTPSAFITVNRTYNSGCYARIGTVCYPIDTDKLPSSAFTDIAQYQKKGDLYLNFNIGELSIVPNREDLSYDKQTIHKITTAITTAQQEITTQVIQRLQTFKTYNDACKGLAQTYAILNSFGWWNSQIIYHPERPKEPLSRFSELSFTGFRVGVIAKTRKNSVRLNHWKNEAVELNITTTYTLHWLPQDAKYLKDRIATFSVPSYSDESTHFVIHGGDYEHVQKLFNDHLITPVRIINEMRPFEPYRSYTTKQEKFTDLFGATYDLRDLPNLLYIKMDDTQSVLTHHDITTLRLAHTTLSKIDFSFPGVVVLNKSKWRFAKHCLGDFEANLQTNLTRTIETLTPSLQKATILNNLTNSYAFTEFLRQCMRLDNPKLRNLQALANKYLGVPQLEDVLTTASLFNIKIPKNETFETEIAYILTQYHPFIDSEIDITTHPILIDLYQSYLDYLPC